MSRELWRVTTNTAGDMPDPEEVHHFHDMDDALSSFMDEVRYTLEHLTAGVPEATTADLGLEGLETRYDTNREATLAAYQSALEGDVQMDILPAVALEQRIPFGHNTWVHVLDKVVMSDEWYEENKDEVN